MAYQKKLHLSDELRQSFTALMEKFARPGIIVTPRVAEAPLTPGASKIGGCPDIVPGFEWPYNLHTQSGEPAPLAFLAQFNLSEIAPWDTLHELPSGGMLYFFQDFDSECWAESPEMGDYARCVYVADASAPERGCFPEGLSEEYHLPEYALSLEAMPVPPDIGNMVEDEEMQAETAALCEGDWDEAEDIYMYLRPKYLKREDEYDHTPLLLGYPDVLQCAMEAECERVVEGEEADEEAARRQWVLLFQFCNVFDAAKREFFFPDYVFGHSYFWIRRDDLAARRFEKAWMVAQCD